MTAIKREFRKLGLATLGPTYQTRIAALFDVDVRTVRRWASDDHPSEPKPDVMDYLQRLASKPTVPRWIFGEAADDYDKQYVIHTADPRFIGRLVFTNEDDEAIGKPANTLSGIVLRGDNWCVCEIVWIDTPKAVGESMRSLANELERAIEEFS